jgi:UDP-N-acetylglucosamine transferase subunit ALG13
MALEKNGFRPIIASDGVALALLKKEFPHLLALELPSYNIEYAKKGENFKWKLLKNSPKTLKAMFSEKDLVKKWIKEYELSGIISDNRLGVHSKKVPSVFITHQLTVLSGKTTWISSKLHQYYIRKFAECWVPDRETLPNLSGKLGHLKQTTLNIKYIGILSRLKKIELPIVYDLMVILSGPEPQRTLLEEKLITELNGFVGKVVFIKGKVENEQKSEEIGTVTYYNFMQTEQLEKTYNESEIILCRSGYTTVMDLVKLEKKALFIPTPGQFEQVFLAKKYKKEGILPTAKQENFKIEDLLSVPLYPGFPKIESEINWSKLFLLFKSE